MTYHHEKIGNYHVRKAANDGVITSDDLEEILAKIDGDQQQVRLQRVVDWIFNFTNKDINELKLISQYLTNFDWQKHIEDKQINEQKYIESILNNGGEVCKGCGILETLRIPYPYGKENAEKYCLVCIRSYERRHDVPYQEQLRPCECCDKFLPAKLLKRDNRIRRIKDSRYGCCKGCFEKAVHDQTITCAICSKTTLEHVAQDVCDDCYIKYPYAGQVSTHIARARQLNAPATLTLAEWASTLEHFNYKCAYCRTSPYTILEHYHPIVLKGGTTADNCLPSCQKCNGKKGGKHPDDFKHLFPSQNIARIQSYFQTITMEVSRP